MRQNKCDRNMTYDHLFVEENAYRISHIWKWQKNLNLCFQHLVWPTERGLCLCRSYRKALVTLYDSKIGRHATQPRDSGSQSHKVELSGDRGSPTSSSCSMAGPYFPQNVTKSYVRTEKCFNTDFQLQIYSRGMSTPALKNFSTSWVWARFLVRVEVLITSL